MRNTRVMAVVLAAAVMLSPLEVTCGASPGPGDPIYHASRYYDDFSWLADPAKASDPWDKIK
jgi:hypothetical protein